MYLQKNRKLHEFATTNIFFFLNRHFQTCIIVKRTCISIFSKIGLVDQSKTCTQIYLQKFLNCNNLQLAIRILKNHAYRTCTTPSRTFRPILSSITQLLAIFSLCLLYMSNEQLPYHTISDVNSFAKK